MLLLWEAYCLPYPCCSLHLTAQLTAQRWYHILLALSYVPLLVTQVLNRLVMHKESTHKDAAMHIRLYLVKTGHIYQHLSTDQGI